MDADVQKFLDLWKEKSAAKAESLAAVGEAKLAEVKGRDADAKKAWQVVEQRGINGAEGALQAEAFALAEKYVAAHPELFGEAYERLVNSDDHGLLVKLIGIFRDEGQHEWAARLSMFELARFERQQIGGNVQVVVKPRK